MNPLDIGVIAVIVLSAIFAFARGFVREALSMVAWVAAAFITFKGFDRAYALVDPHVHNPLLSQVIAGFGLFVVSLVILTIATGFLARLVHASGLTPIDRTLGFIFGLARGAFLVCLAYLLMDLSVQPNDRPVWIRDAKSAVFLHEGADVLKGFLPESLKIKNAEDMLKPLSPEQLAKKASSAYAKPGEAAARPDAAAAPNYPTRDKRELDRLIGTQQR